MRFFSMLVLLLAGLTSHATNKIDVSKLIVGESGDVYGLAYATMECMDNATRQVSKQYGLIGGNSSAQGLIAFVKRITVIAPQLASPADVDAIVSVRSDALDKQLNASCRLYLSALDAAVVLIMDSTKN